MFGAAGKLTQAKRRSHQAAVNGFQDTYNKTVTLGSFACQIKVKLSLLE